MQKRQYSAMMICFNKKRNFIHCNAYQIEGKSYIDKGIFINFPHHSITP